MFFIKFLKDAKKVEEGLINYFSSTLYIDKVKAFPSPSLPD